ncbi:MAG: type II toxin-antitoxin system RelE/ParE family toxin [Deltaproteobacteria bacterium]|nr:type II toxin-antitoxin system RelE/ParE family toxin [Deltaproteobacteria bacterium]
MSPPYKVQWTAGADEDLKNIVLFIAEESPQSARAIFAKIKEQTSNLSHFPERGRTVPELHDQGIFLYRELIISPWRIVYRIADNKVYIMLVMDSRQNPEDILLKRFTRGARLNPDGR